VPALSSIHKNIDACLPDSEDARYLKRLISRFSNASKKTAGRPPVVDLISFLDLHIRQGRPLDRKITTNRLRAMRVLFTAALAKAVSSHKGRARRIPKLAGVSGRVRIPDYIMRFAKKLSSGEWDAEANRLRFADVVITTNYDSCVDLALYWLAYEKGTGISDVFLGSTFRDPYDDADAFSDTKRPVALLKLHGSVNWLYCPLCGRVYVSAFENNVLYLMPGMRRSDEETCFCLYYPLEPVIIAPTALQDIDNPHLTNVWIAAHQALEEAEEWTVVGYSLPSEDLAIRGLLYRALEVRRRLKKTTRVLVVNPELSNRELLDKYEAFFGQPVVAHALGFVDYVNSQMP
jgi:hypothetical protein